MRTRNTRMSVALLIVLASIMFATLACYSGQIPGLFELTPDYTPTAPAVPKESKFEVLEVLLAPEEPGRAFFNLTLNPEPLDASLVNSKRSCEGGSSAQVLYVGEDHNGEVFYLVNCVGSVGWAAEDRLAGPLDFSKDDLAIALAPEGGAGNAVELLDRLNGFRPMPANPLQKCNPESLVRVTAIEAVDHDNDGIRTIFYEIECPTMAGPLRGWVDTTSLFGPMEIDINAKAIAVDPADGTFGLTIDPVPLAEGELVEGECNAGDVLTALEVKLVGDTAYYKMSCGDVEGWASQAFFVGPLRFEVGMNTVIYTPPVQVFADTLPAVGDDGDDGDDDAAVPNDGGDEIALHEREVLIISPPINLTADPGQAILTGDDANVIGQCDSGQVAYINAYAAVDKVYLNVDCKECVAQDDDGNCEEYVEHTGWADQRYLQGPIDFVIDQQVVFAERSKVVQADDDGVLWARIPPTIGSAEILGDNTQFAGRCLIEEPITVTGIVLQKDRTRNRFSFFYTIECTGQSSNIIQGELGTNVTVEYNDDDVLITGYASARDLEPYAE